MCVFVHVCAHVMILLFICARFLKNSDFQVTVT